MYCTLLLVCRSVAAWIVIGVALSSSWAVTGPATCYVATRPVTLSRLALYASDASRLSFLLPLRSDFSSNSHPLLTQQHFRLFCFSPLETFTSSLVLVPPPFFFLRFFSPFSSDLAFSLSPFSSLPYRIPVSEIPRSSLGKLSSWETLTCLGRLFPTTTPATTADHRLGGASVASQLQARRDRH